MNTWTFPDSPQSACFTTDSVLAGAPILYVVHDYEADWLFMNGSEPAEDLESAKVVALGEIVRIDPSLASLHDLDYGWAAERTAVDQPWQCYRNVPFPSFEEQGYYLEDALWLADFLPDITPPDEDIRNNLQAGDFVKLVFRFAAEDAPREDGQCERMWVQVTGQDDEGNYLGTLENDPVHDAAACGDELQFHPRHVMAIATDE